MNSPCSPERAEACSAQSCSAGTPSDTSSGTTTASGSLPSGSLTAVCPAPPFSAMSVHSSVTGTPPHIRDWLMSFRVDSPASHFPLPANEPEPTIPATCGPQRGTLFALYDRALHFWKTYQVFLALDISGEFSETWPRSGTMRNGQCSELMMSARRTDVNDCGYWPTPRASEAGPDYAKIERSATGISLPTAVNLWPTPRAGKYTNENEQTWKARRDSGRVSTPPLSLAVRMFPTPTTQDGKNNGSQSQQERNTPPLNAVVGGSLNPAWVEWLMGWPLEWTSTEPMRSGAWAAWQQAFWTAPNA